MCNRHGDVGKAGAVHIGQVDARCGAQADGLAAFGERGCVVCRSYGGVQVQRGRVIGTPDGDGQCGRVCQILTVGSHAIFHLISETLGQGVIHIEGLHIRQ